MSEECCEEQYSERQKGEQKFKLKFLQIKKSFYDWKIATKRNWDW